MTGTPPPPDGGAGPPAGAPIRLTGSFPAAHGVRPHQHLPSRTLLAFLLAGLALLTVALVLVAVTSEPGPAPKCGPLGCKAPPIRPAVTDQSAGQPGGAPLYTAKSGFSLRNFPITGTSLYPKVQTSGDTILLTYPFNDRAGGQSQLEVVGQKDNGASPETIVSDVVKSIAPNATLSYVLPGAYVGYVSGYGEAFTTEVASSDGSATTYQLIVLAAVKNNFEIAVAAVGSLLDVRPNTLFYNGHPSPAANSAAYLADPTVNSIRFPG